MPEQMRPASTELAPDPTVQFDRSDPKKESGQGQLDINTNATPTPEADALPQTVEHAQAGDRQINGEDAAVIAPKTEAGKKESLGWKKQLK